MLFWDSVKSEFVWEGSWRDVVVPGVGIAEWRAAVRSVVDAGFHGSFSVDGVESDLPDDVEMLFERRGETSPLWSLSIVGVLLVCHFFEESKIECARKFFAKITSEQVKYDVVNSYGKLIELVK